MHGFTTSISNETVKTRKSSSNTKNEKARKQKSTAASVSAIETVLAHRNKESTDLELILSCTATRIAKADPFPAASSAVAASIAVAHGVPQPSRRNRKNY